MVGRSAENMFKHFDAFVRLLAVEKINDFFFFLRDKIEVGNSSATISVT